MVAHMNFRIKWTAPGLKAGLKAILPLKAIFDDTPMPEHAWLRTVTARERPFGAASNTTTNGAMLENRLNWVEPALRWRERL